MTLSLEYSGSSRDPGTRVSLKKPHTGSWANKETSGSSESDVDGWKLVKEIASSQSEHGVFASDTFI